jgi:transposase
LTEDRTSLFGACVLVGTFVDAGDLRLKARIVSLTRSRDEYRKLYLSALEQIRKLELGLLGQKAERLSGTDGQLALAILETLLGSEPSRSDLPTEDLDDEEEQEDQESKPEKRKPRRTRPPAELPRVQIEIIPPEVQRKGLDAFVRIGEEVVESLENRPASQVVLRVVKPKFKEKGSSDGQRPEAPSENGSSVMVAPSSEEEGSRTSESTEKKPVKIYIAETPELPIKRGSAGPGFLAQSIVRRWQDHLPLHRLESIYAREGVRIARSTMCGWHEELAALTRPVIDAMWKDALKQPYLCTDATGVLVQAKEKCRHGHFWVVVAPELHVLFRYSKKHDSHAVDRMLEGYQGYVVADAHTVYDHLFGENGATECGCWAHGRRYHFKSLGTDPDRARVALGMINALFRIERSIATAPRKKREKVRSEKSRPIVERYFEWCGAEIGRVIDETPIARAIRYSLNQEAALRRFLEDGRLPMHNNISELHLRRQKIGGKNWLFVGSDDAAEVNAVFTSLLASCQLHGIEPYGYLRDIFCLLPSWPIPRVLDLAPAYWKKTFEQDETQRKLDANIYRRVSLGLDPIHPSAQ